MLDETLAEIHDKNMFDEHLGLMKEAEDLMMQEKAAKEEATSTENTKTDVAGDYICYCYFVTCVHFINSVQLFLHRNRFSFFAQLGCLLILCSSERTKIGSYIGEVWLCSFKC